MTAKVSNIFLCPKCGVPQTAEIRPNRCASVNCGFRFRLPGEDLAQEFSWGKSPYVQLYELVQQDMEKYKDRPINELIPSIPPETAKDAVVSNKMRHKFIQGKREKEMAKFFTDSSSADLEEWYKSLLYMFQVMHLSGDPKLIAACILMGKELGDYAEDVLKPLLNKGAKLYGPLINIPTKPGSSD